MELSNPFTYDTEVVDPALDELGARREYDAQIEAELAELALRREYDALFEVEAEVAAAKEDFVVATAKQLVEHLLAEIKTVKAANRVLRGQIAVLTREAR